MHFIGFPTEKKTLQGGNNDWLIFLVKMAKEFI